MLDLGFLPSDEGVPITSPDVLENPRYGRWRRDDQHAYGSRMEMENSRDWRPNEVGRFGTMNINYSRPHTLTQDVEIRAPRAVRVVRTLRIGLPATAMASPLRTHTSLTKSKEFSFQIAEFAVNHPILAMFVLGLIALIGSVCIFALPTGWLPF